MWQLLKETRKETGWTLWRRRVHRPRRTRALGKRAPSGSDEYWGATRAPSQRGPKLTRSFPQSCPLNRIEIGPDIALGVGAASHGSGLGTWAEGLGPRDLGIELWAPDLGIKPWAQSCGPRAGIGGVRANP